MSASSPRSERRHPDLLPSVTRLASLEAPWLCVPASRRVCPFGRCLSIVVCCVPIRPAGRPALASRRLARTFVQVVDDFDRHAHTRQRERLRRRIPVVAPRVERFAQLYAETVTERKPGAGDDPPTLV